jgi:glycosyltransferase involved in cell wall biosynthesis
VTEFTDALQALLEDEGLRQQLALGARVRAHRSTWDAAVDDTEAMYGVRVLA